MFSDAALSQVGHGMVQANYNDDSPDALSMGGDIGCNWAFRNQALRNATTNKLPAGHNLNELLWKTGKSG